MRATVTDIASAIINGDFEVQVARDDRDTIRAGLRAMGYDFSDAVFNRSMVLAKQDPYMARMIQHFKPVAA